MATQMKTWRESRGTRGRLRDMALLVAAVAVVVACGFASPSAAEGAVEPAAGFRGPHVASRAASLVVASEEADGSALAPSASIPSGTYLADQETTLVANEPGGTTYYTLDGSDPSDAGNAKRLVYDGEPIRIERRIATCEDVAVERGVAGEDAGETAETAAGEPEEGAAGKVATETVTKRVIYVKACTAVAGKHVSDVSEYRYEFADIPVPVARDCEYDATEHIGVAAGPYFTLRVEPDGDARIDERGNAVATAPGTYKVTAALELPDDWWATDEQGGRSQEDQVVEFTITAEAPVGPTDEDRARTPTSPSPNDAPARGDAIRKAAPTAKAKASLPGSDPNQKGLDGTSLGPGASAAAAEAAIMSMKTDADPKGAAFGKLRLRSTRQTKNAIMLTWKKAKGAKKYVVYGNKCGKKNKMCELIVTTKVAKVFKQVQAKRLKKGTYYKFIVVALNKKNNVVSTSKVVHVATKGGKMGNYKEVLVEKEVLSRAKKLKKGKTLKLGARAQTASEELKVKKHVGLRYESTNPKIATVSKKGVVKAKKKGKAAVYAYAQNGTFKKVAIVVK